MLLCVDIGNTNIKLGLYNGDKLVSHWRIFTDPSKLSDEYAVLLLSLFASENIKNEMIDGCAISSVVPDLTIAFRDLVKRHLGLEPVIVGSVKRPVIHINTDNPAEVGPDLIANAVGAISLYGAPVIIIGFGTATTFSAISANGDFEGVAIDPFIAVRFDLWICWIGGRAGCTHEEGTRRECPGSGNWRAGRPDRWGGNLH
jgi:type III pantothenate kinase